MAKSNPSYLQHRNHKNIYKDLAYSKSNNNPLEKNSRGHLGLYQMRQNNLKDIGYIDPLTLKWTNKHSIKSATDFLHNSFIQEVAIREYFQLLWDKYLINKQHWIGKEILGVKLTKPNLIVTTYIVGKVNMEDYLNSQGHKNAEDECEILVSEYLNDYSEYKLDYSLDVHLRALEYMQTHPHFEVNKVFKAMKFDKTMCIMTHSLTDLFAAYLGNKKLMYEKLVAIKIKEATTNVDDLLVRIDQLITDIENTGGINWTDEQQKIINNQVIFAKLKALGAENANTSNLLNRNNMNLTSLDNLLKVLKDVYEDEFTKLKQQVHFSLISLREEIAEEVKQKDGVIKIYISIIKELMIYDVSHNCEDTVVDAVALDPIFSVEKFAELIGINQSPTNE